MGEQMSHRFRSSLLSVTLFIGAIVPLCAQVTIQKNGVGVPEGQVEILFRTSCRVMAEEFHLDNGCGADFPVTLVLGDLNERVKRRRIEPSVFHLHESVKRGSVRYLCQQTDSAAYGFERSKNKNSCRDFAAGEPDGAGIATRIAGSDRISSLIPASVTAAPWGSVLPAYYSPSLRSRL